MSCWQTLVPRPSTSWARLLQTSVWRNFSSNTPKHTIRTINTSTCNSRRSRQLARNTLCQIHAFRSNHILSSLEPKAVDAVEKDRLYEMSLVISRTPMNSNAEVQCIFYDGAGVAKDTKKMTKLQIAQEYQLSTRDLRTIDLASAGFPHILIRDKTILIHLFDLRLLVQADRAVLFDIDEDIGREHSDNTSRLFSHNLEDKVHYGHGFGAPSSMPYELRVLETALTSVTSTLEAQYLLAKRQVAEALTNLNEDSVMHSELRKLLDLVRGLTRIEQRAKHVRDAVQEVLNDDQDMADMYLSDKRAGMPHEIEDHQSVEYLLEAIHKASDAVVQQTGGLLGDIRRTEETIQSILNVRRNQIMVLEAKIEILMVGLASATLVAGWYGMNVVNYSEDSSWAFGALTAVCLIGTAVVWRIGSRRLRNIQTTRLKR